MWRLLPGSRLSEAFWARVSTWVFLLTVDFGEVIAYGLLEKLCCCRIWQLPCRKLNWAKLAPFFFYDFSDHPDRLVVESLLGFSFSRQNVLESPHYAVLFVGSGPTGTSGVPLCTVPRVIDTHPIWSTCSL